MIGLTLWALTALYLLLFILAGAKNDTWKERFRWWVILLIPLVFWLWDYPVIKYQHEQACKQDGGLRVLIQPEKTDLIQLDGNHYGYRYAEEFLEKHYPKLQVVEARETSGPGTDRYFAYSVDPSSVGAGAKNYKYLKTSLRQPTPGLYLLTEENGLKATFSGFKNQTMLMRNGQLYAKWTTYQATWHGFSLIGGGTIWQCHTKTQMNMVYEDYLINLMLK